MPPRRSHSAPRSNPLAEAKAAALAEVRAVYAELARRPVQRDCTLLTECCQFKITGLTPYLTKGEALVAARGVRAAGRKQLPERADGACPLLHPQTGRCMIYAERPFGCRTHFCPAAGGPYARSEVIDLIRRLEAVDATLGGNGPRMLPGAVADALEQM
ncbi:MAG: YkgJ family cysteine cluster protein [Verrucomicrobiota bacterium]